MSKSRKNRFPRKSSPKGMTARLDARLAGYKETLSHVTNKDAYRAPGSMKNY